jgi:branched-chain amino acid transport system substrate-binding protein
MKHPVMQKHFFVLIVILSLLFFCAGGGQEKQDRQGGNFITIGVYEPLTGIHAGGGNLELEGIKLANELNPTVNIGGQAYQVYLAVEDNKSEREDTVSALQLLIDREKASVILGTWDSGLASAGSDVIRRNNIPAIGITCTGPRITTRNNNYFRICFNDSMQAYALAKYANDALNAHTGIIIYEQNNSAFDTLHEDIVKRFKEYFVTYRSGRRGYNTILDEFEIYAGANQDFSGLLVGTRKDADDLPSVRELNPQVIFIAANYQEVVQIVRQARRYGLKIPIIGTANLDTPDFFAAGGADLEGILFASHFNLDMASTPKAATFIREYKARNDDLNPPSVVALAYDGYMLALDAVGRAQSTDPGKIRAAIAATRGNFAGATGQIILDNNGDAQKSIFIKAVEKGTVVHKTTVNPVSTSR